MGASGLNGLQLQTRTGLGIFLAFTGGLLISLDIPILRLAEADAWFTMFFRGISLAIILGCVIRFGKGWTDTPPNPFMDRQWVEVGIYYGLTVMFFILAVFNTSAANLVFILAFNPMMAALFAWWFFGEKPSLVTWIAIFVTAFGVMLIVSEGVQGGTFKGDFFAFMAAVVLALSIVRSRQSGKDMSLSGCLGGMIGAAVALPMLVMNYQFPGQFHWLALNALIIAPAASFSLQLAPRFIPAAQVSMFFLLETVLAPVWIWLVFGEIPTQMTLIGGTIVLSAIAGHSFYQLKPSKTSTG